MQAKADPRRRAERVFPEAIYDATVALPPAARRHPRRPSAALDRDAVAAAPRAGSCDPAARDARRRRRPVAASTCRAARRGALRRLARPGRRQRPRADACRRQRRRRPGRARRPARARRSRSSASATSALPRKTPDFHAVAVLNAILGGIFNSRLNRVIREEQGYTYGDLFGVRHAPLAPGRSRSATAVETEVTVPALERHPGDRQRHPRGRRRAERARRSRATTSSASSRCASRLPARSPPRSPAWSSSGCPTTSSTATGRRSRRSRRRRCSTPRERHIRPDELSVVVVGDATKVEARCATPASVRSMTVVGRPTPRPSDRRRRAAAGSTRTAQL